MGDFLSRCQMYRALQLAITICWHHQHHIRLQHTLELQSSKNWVTSPSVKRIFMASQSLSQVFEHPKRILWAFMAKNDDGQMKIMPHEGKRILQLSMGEESEQHQYALHRATV